MTDSEQAYELAKKHGIEITGNKDAGYILIYPDGSGMFWDDKQQTFPSPGELLPILR